MDEITRRESLKIAPAIGFAAFAHTCLGAAMGKTDEIDLPDSEIEIHLLRAMELLGPQRLDGFRKCNVVLQHALKAARKWTEAAEPALANGGCEEAEVKRFYDVLRRLVKTEFAEGRGNLRLEKYAGPRYTECRVTPAGLTRLRALS